MKLSAKILLLFLLGTGLLDAASSTNQALVINTNNSRIANFTNFFLANTNLSVPAHAAYFTPTFVAGSAGSDFAISSSGTTHTFNLPTASALTRGLLSGADWTTFNSKAAASHTHAAADITSGTIDPARLGSGTSISTKYLRGDSTWQTVAGGGGDALVANPLSQFAATTSAQLRGVISDEIGSGAAVFADSPSLTNPNIGAATASLLTLPVGSKSIPSVIFSGAATNTGLHFSTSGTAPGIGLSIGGTSFLYSGDTSVGLSIHSGWPYSWGSSAADSTPDLFLRRDAANTLAQRNGVNAQSFRLYNTYTDASNFERLGIVWSGNSAYLNIEHLGTGSKRALHVDGSDLYLRSSSSGTGTIRWQLNSSGNFLAYADNSYDIGASGASRPRNGYFGTSVVTPAATVSNVTLTGTITFPAGVRQTLAPNSTTPGLNVGSVASDPSSLSNGDVWLNSTSGRLRTRLGGASVDVATGAQQDFELTTVTSGATIAIDLNANQYQTLALATDATTVTTSNRSATKGRAVTLFVLASGAQRTFTLNGSWRNFNGGSTSVVIPSGKEAAISLFCTGSAETDVRVSYTIQP